MKPNNKPSITDYILLYPGASIDDIMKGTGTQRDSVSSVLTMIRRAYRGAPVNSAGLRTPEGLPPFTEDMFEQLISKRQPTPYKRGVTKKKKFTLVKKEKKPIDMTAQPVKMPEEPPAPIVKARVEAIDLIESYGLGFHLGMVIEYICMASRMGTTPDGIRSLELARMYLDRALSKNVELNVSR